MDAVAASSVTISDPAALREMAHNQRLTESAKLQEAGRQFEAVLLRQMLKETMAPVIGGGILEGSGGGSSLYRQMVTDTLADALTQHRSFGFSSALMQQFAPPPDSPADEPSR